MSSGSDEEGQQQDAPVFDEFKIAALNAHNRHRANHGVGPLRLTQEWCNIAQNWANRLARSGQLQHSSSTQRGGSGENLYMTTGGVPRGAAPVDAWYSEISDYNSWTNFTNRPTGHYTQVVWRGSQELGIAYARGPSGVYVVANYYPPGNVHGRYDTNVLPRQ